MFRKKKGSQARNRRSLRSHETEEEEDKEDTSVVKDQDNRSQPIKTETTTPQGDEPLPSNEDHTDEEKEDSGVALNLQERLRQTRKRQKRTYDASTTSSSVARTVVLTQAKRSPRKKRKGYGAATLLDGNDTGDINSDEELEGEATTLYDPDALAKLKAEQQQWNQEFQMELVDEENEMQTKAENEMQTKVSHSFQNDMSSSRASPTYEILTGDAAIEAATVADKEKRTAVESIKVHDDIDTRTRSDVVGDAVKSELGDEEFMTKSMGPLPDLLPTKLSGTPPETNNAIDSPTGINSWSAIQKHFHIAASRVEQQIGTLERSIMEQEEDLAEARDNLAKRNDLVSSIGKKIDFHQEWRNRLLPWVGALRDLHSRIHDTGALSTTLWELMAEYKTAVEERCQWDLEDALLALPSSTEVSFLGNHVDLADLRAKYDANVTKVDEFGRTLKSKFAIEAEKREKRRSQVRVEEEHDSHICKGGTWNVFLMEELQDWGDRWTAIRKAATVAEENLESKFTKISNLFEMFDDWYEAYAGDYGDCYASLSLAELAAILLQFQILFRFLSAGLPFRNRVNENEGVMKFPHALILKYARLMDSEAIERLLDKGALKPFVHSLMDKSAYFLGSDRQTHYLTGIVGQASEVWRASCGSRLSNRLCRVCDQMVSYLCSSLEQISLPVLEQAIERENVSINFSAALGKHHERVHKVLSNTLVWARVFQGILLDDNARKQQLQLRGVVLSFLQNYLPYLSSLKSIPISHNGSPQLADSFEKVLHMLRGLNWLDDDDGNPDQWRIAIMTIRAAENVFGSNGVNS